MRRPTTALVLTAVLAAALSGCSADTPAAALLSPAAADAPLPVPTAQVPVPGEVLQGEGPFDDRFVLSGLGLRNGAAVGTLDVTSDVSELIVLEVHAGFYDAAGALLGTELQVHRDEHPSAEVHTGDETVDVAVPAAPDYAGKAVAATVWVPVLVNE